MVLKLNPVFVKRIWGGERISKEFNLKNSGYGEAWIISGYKDKASKINGKEITLDKFYKENKEEFNNYPTDDFPLLVKFIDAKKDLSIQVHPDDWYAKEVEKKPFGKYETWVILDTKENNHIIVGHDFKDKQDVKNTYQNKNWDSKLKKQSIKKGDVFDIRPGTIHAICANTYVYEIQQSSDLTYRLYDYDRKENGKLRRLHIEKSIDVIDYDIKNVIPIMGRSQMIYVDNWNHEQLINNKYFTLYRWNITGKCIVPSWYKNFILVTCVEGQGTINGEKIIKNESVILTKEDLKKIECSGNMELLVGMPN